MQSFVTFVAGQSAPNVLSAAAVDMPLRFVDKQVRQSHVLSAKSDDCTAQVLAVTIDNAYMIEADRVAMPFTYCEVFAPSGISAMVKVKVFLARAVHVQILTASKAILRCLQACGRD